MEVVGLMVLASALQASGTVLQKQRVATCSAGVSLGEVARGPARFFVPLVRDPFWLMGYMLTVSGAMVGVQAFSMADLTVVKSLGRLDILFMVLAGAVLLGERLTWREGLGLGLMSGGGLFLATTAGTTTGVPTTTLTYVIFLGASAGLLGLLWLVHARFPARLRPELALAIAAGILFGTSDVLLKGATALVTAARDGFSILDLSSLTALARTPQLGLALATYLGGVIILQAGFSVGRVSVIGPALGLSGSLLPILFGLGVLRESVSVERLLTIALMLLGAVFLAEHRSDRDADRRHSAAHTPATIASVALLVVMLHSPVNAHQGKEACMAEDPVLAVAQGQRLFEEKRYDEAIECFEVAANAEPNRSDHHVWLGRAYGRKAETAGMWDQVGLAKKVRTEFETAVALDPDNLAARLSLVEYYLAAPGFMGGGTDKARAQAVEIEKRDQVQGGQARALIERAEGTAEAP